MLAGQKKPAEHWFVRSAVLPVARHEPTEQGRHEDADLKDAPPPEYVPGRQGFAVPVTWPATQKWPAGHGAAVAVTEPAAQK